MTDRNSSRGRDRDDERPSRGRDRDDERPTRGRDREESPRRGREEESDSRGRDRSERGSSRDRDERPSRGRDRDDEDRGSSRGRSSRSSSYEYQARSSEDTKQRAASGANDFDRLFLPHIKTWKPNDGDNRIRILPPTWAKAKHFGVDVHVHYGVGADKGAYLDLNKMLGEPDPIHEEYQRARDELDPDNKDDQEYLRQLKGTRRDAIYLIDRDHEKEGVQAWLMPFGLGNDVVKLTIDKQTGEVLPIDHPEEGYDVEFTKTGKGINTKYSAPAIARRSSPLGKDEWLDYAMDNPLPDQLQYFDYDHIAKAFGGQGAHREKPRGRDRDDDRDDDRPAHGHDRDEAPSRGRDRDAPPARGRASVPDDSPTWESVHEMTGRELEDLVEQEKLDINPNEAKDDDDLADWICDEMKLTKAPAKSSRRATADDDDDASRLRKMREGRRD